MSEFNEEKAKQFADTIKTLATLLQMIPIPILCQAMTEDTVNDAIQRALDQRKKWSDAFSTLANDLDRQLDKYAVMVTTINRMKIELRPFVNDINKFYEQSGELERLVNLCDRLEAHRKSGLLSAVATMNQTPP